MLIPVRYRCVIHPDFESLRDELQRIPELFLKGEGEVIYEGRNELRSFQMGGRCLVVKSFRRPNAVNRLVYGFLRSSKAERSYRNALLLESLGIGTPRPVAFMTFRSGLLFSRSYYVSLRSECPYTYRDLLSQGISYCSEVLEEIGKATARLHQAGWVHMDYSRGNLLFGRDSDGTVRLEIVDLNRMRRVRVSMERGCRNFERLPAFPWMRKHLALSYARARGYDAEECERLIRHYRLGSHDLVPGES